MLSDSGRVELKDKAFTTDISRTAFTNQLFTRLVAKSRRFEHVDFRYTIFDTCYLRTCTFDSCDFTGCRFLGTNLHGSTFTGCRFDYTIFERTIVDSDVLQTNAPAVENLKLRFARTLRMNYQQLGDASSVNKAIKLELEATQTHLHKAWHSNESYYRRKYAGLARVRAFVQWLEFRLLDFIWGNSESTWKLIRTVALLLVAVALIDIWTTLGKPYAHNLFDAIWLAPPLLLGTSSPDYYSKIYLAILVFLRLISMALFLSVIIKRFSRR